MDTFIFPHMKYIVDNIYTYERYELYLGGEPIENDTRLTIGKKYQLHTVMYAETVNDKRERVWVCPDDENKGKLCRIHLKNFGDYSDLRDKRLNSILL